VISCSSGEIHRQVVAGASNYKFRSSRCPWTLSFNRAMLGSRNRWNRGLAPCAITIHHDLGTIIIERKSVISTLEPCSVLSQGIREANPPLTVDVKFYDLGTSELLLFPGCLVGLLGHQFAWGKAIAGSGTCPAFNMGTGVQSGGLC